jgi:hypothetical protein
MQTIHIVGDSIARGYGLGVFADAVAASNGLYHFSSIARTGNLVCRDNGIPARFAYHPVILMDPAAPAFLSACCANGIIAPGDWLILEDAGDHSQNPDDYEGKWNALLAALSGTGVHVAMMTMFDYAPAPTNSQFNTAFTGSPSGISRTMNAATTAAAANGGALLIDMRTAINAFKSYCNGQTLTPVIYPDGIHPNVWGQTRMLGVIMEAVGLRPYIRTLALPSSIIAANFASLSYGNTTYYTAAWAQTFLAKALIP